MKLKDMILKESGIKKKDFNNCKCNQKEKASNEFLIYIFIITIFIIR